jgi:serine/threonine protein phosphatase PrpC
MNVSDWKFILASVVGTSHAKTDTPCQDASACTLLNTTGGSSVLVAVAADGAGSARKSDIGASLACSLFIEEMKSLFELEGGVDEITADFVKGWITRFQNEVALRAEAEELKPRDFACTLLAAVVGTDKAAFAQIGDGAIVISSREEPEEYNYVFWPQQGEYANITNFLTDPEAHDKIEHTLVNGEIDEVAIFSDGIQNLALHYESKTAHSPFFGPVFSWLRPAPDGYSEKLSSSLASYLNSQKINDCTDDDKTLILATRRTNPAPAVANEQSDGSEGEATSI